MNPMLESFNNQTGRVRQNNSIILVPKTLDRSKPFKVLWPNHLKNIPKNPVGARKTTSRKTDVNHTSTVYI